MRENFQMAPSYDPTKEAKSTMTKFERLMKKRNYAQSSSMVTQPWKKNGSCPEGTIPVRRIRKKDLLNANSVEAYGRKKHCFSGRQESQSSTSDNNKTVDLGLQRANHSVYCSSITYIFVLARYPINQKLF